MSPVTLAITDRSSASASPPGSASPTPANAHIETLFQVDYGDLLEALSRADAAVAEYACDDHVARRPPPQLRAEDARQLTSLYDEMIERFFQPPFPELYGYRETDRLVAGLQAGEPVPGYFANAKSGTIFYRKALAMAGLRNLVLAGPEIFVELQTQLFSSDPKQYAPGTGLARMKLLTGNTVDLDTVVLRCSDPVVLRTINAMNSRHGSQPFKDARAFGASEQAKQIALNTAEKLLDDFATLFRLTPAQRRKRRLQLPKVAAAIPVARHNTDRGKHPVWQYVNCGQNSYHANVPHLPDVIGALLRAPIAAGRAFVQCREDDELLRQFYEDGIADSCFNMKWKALEEFVGSLGRVGTVQHLLETTEAQNQEIFTQAFFDADDERHSRETEELWRLVRGRTARDATGFTRLVTLADVQRWVADPAAAI